MGITKNGTVIATWGSNHFRVRLSGNGGETWGPSAYSSMAVGRAGTPSEGLIYLLYGNGQGAKMARFNLTWVTEGRNWRECISNK